MGRETGCVQGFIKLGLDDSFRVWEMPPLTRPLPGALRCVPTELMSSNKTESYLQGKGHGNGRGSHESWSSVLRPL